MKYSHSPFLLFSLLLLWSVHGKWKRAIFCKSATLHEIATFECTPFRKCDRYVFEWNSSSTSDEENWINTRISFGWMEEGCKIGFWQREAMRNENSNKMVRFGVLLSKHWKCAVPKCRTRPLISSWGNLKSHERYRDWSCLILPGLRAWLGLPLDLSTSSSPHFKWKEKKGEIFDEAIILSDNLCQFRECTFKGMSASAHFIYAADTKLYCSIVSCVFLGISANE